ncbi:MAG: hypothetical protein HY343_06360 [Lentisphaerae bacterium]|nr:hypothetical protein [Lentisphaerota bacterium]
MKRGSVLGMSALVLLGLVVASGTAFARLGETKDQCDQRYGTGSTVQTNDSLVRYARQGLEIICLFRDGKCDAITYQVGESGLDRLAFDRATELLYKNSEDYKWEPPYETKTFFEIDVAGNHVQWNRSDGAYGIYTHYNRRVRLDVFCRQMDARERRDYFDATKKGDRSRLWSIDRRDAEQATLF